MSTRERADRLLVARGLFPSRAKAAEAIAAGLVAADGRAVAKPSEPLPPEASIQARAPYPWVGRGGCKLAAALDGFGVDPAGRACLDVGASTGGFTDVLLTRGARHVTAVDVGHGQLHPRVAADGRVRALEKRDARTLRPDDFAEAPSLIVADVSFISLTLVLPAVLPLAAPATDLVALAKPQFEGARARKGIVSKEAERRSAVERIEACLAALRWSVRGRMTSPIAGGDGNVEFLLHARQDGS